ncbi:MAG: protein translocase subunit SecD [Clostridia bacterium]|nr:protein translocase subunit SecD [Clostridia bacterium]
MKLKKTGKLNFFVVFILILALTYTAFFGVENYYGDNREIIFKGAQDIRWGIDIKGGVEAVFSPNKKDVEITAEDMDAAKAIIETRLVNENITDYEVYTDSGNHQIIVRFPWEAGESDFDAVATVKKLGTSAVLVFRKGSEKTGKIVLQGAADVKSTYPAVDPETNNPLVALELTSQGKDKFAAATAAMKGQQISIWLSTTTSELDENGEPIVEEVLLSAPTVQEVITNGECTISGDGMTAEYVKELSEQINSGKLPFALTVDDSKLQIISPTLGSDALRVMLIAGAIAFGVVCLLMILRYRLNGVVAAIALLGQLAGSIACISGFFGSVNSFTLTVPGIAGIILSVGVGVDCNVIAAERIRDEFEKGKTIDGAIDSGFKNSLSAIIDGNVTIVIVSLVLMGAFGSPDGIMAKIFSPIMSLFGTAITGSIYSFGYTLLVGTIFNLIMGVVASKLMLKSISKFKVFRKPWFYGGKTNA